MRCARGGSKVEVGSKGYAERICDAKYVAFHYRVSEKRFAFRTRSIDVIKMPSWTEATAIMTPADVSDAVCEAPKTINSLHDDELLLITWHVERFPSLLHLKRVSKQFATFARKALSSSRWERARKMNLREGTEDCSWVIRNAVLNEDVFTTDALLHLGRSNFNELHNTAVSSSLHNAQSAAMVALLLEYGADIEDTRSGGQTPLMDAASAGNVEVVRALCEHRADVHARDAPDGLTALRYACVGLRSASPDDGVACVRVLVEFGARTGSFTRSEWYAEEDLSELPDEYVPGFH